MDDGKDVSKVTYVNSSLATHRCESTAQASGPLFNLENHEGYPGWTLAPCWLSSKTIATWISGRQA